MANTNEAALAYIGIRLSLNDGRVIQEGTFDTTSVFGAKSTKSRDEKRKTLLSTCSTGEEIFDALRAMIPIIYEQQIFKSEDYGSFGVEFPELVKALTSGIVVVDIKSIEIVVRTFSDDFHAWKVDERFGEYFDADSDMLDFVYDDWIEHGWDLSWTPQSGKASLRKFGSVKNTYW